MEIVETLASDTMYSHHNWFEIKNDKFWFSCKFGSSAAAQFDFESVQLHFANITIAKFAYTRTCPRPLSPGTNAKSQFPAVRASNDSRWRFTAKCVVWWKLFWICIHVKIKILVLPISRKMIRYVMYVIYSIPSVLDSFSFKWQMLKAEIRKLKDWRFSIKLFSVYTFSFKININKIYFSNRKVIIILAKIE